MLAGPPKCRNSQATARRKSRDAECYLVWNIGGKDNKTYDQQNATDQQPYEVGKVRCREFLCNDLRTAQFLTKSNSVLHIDYLFFPLFAGIFWVGHYTSNLKSITLFLRPDT